MKLLKSKKSKLINIYITKNFNILKNIKKIFFLILDYNIFINFFNIIKNNILNFFFIIIPYGEKNKNLNILKIIWKFMIKNKINKNNLIIGIGGGVINDIIGYICFSYFRGIKFILFPTSLLSQIDSSIGGKNAINFYAKNSIGSIYFPIFVLINNIIIYFMKKNEFKDGYAEIIKYSLINSKKLFYYLFNKININILIIQCSYIKLKIISQDYYENNIRSSLNLGHTYAHCIENNNILNYSHGVSVTFGLIFALFISSLFFIINKKIIKKIIFLLKIYNFKIKNILNFSFLMINKFILDKKFDNKINFIIIKKIGNCCQKIIKKKIIIYLIKKYYEI